MKVELSSGELIAGYSDLLDRSRRMLEHAREGQWRALIEEESWFIAELERLGQLEQECPLSPDLQEVKDDLLERILERNLAVRNYLAMRQEALERSLDEEAGKSPEMAGITVSVKNGFAPNAGGLDNEPG